MPQPQFHKTMLVEGKASSHLANVFLTRFELIWPISSLKMRSGKKTEYDVVNFVFTRSFVLDSEEL